MMIQKLRDGSDGVLAKILVGLIIVVFALFGFGSITTYLAPVPKVATVNGEDISQQEMEIAVERSRRLQLAQNREIDEDRLRESVLQSLITREVLSQATQEMDLFFSDSALDAEIIATEVFQLNGVFNPEQFQMVIGGAGYSPVRYRDEMRTDKLFSQILSGIRQSSFLTKDEALRYSGLSLQTRDLSYLRIKVDDLLDLVTVSDEQIEAYYKENPSDFVTEETVNIEYIELKRDDIAADVEFTPMELQSFYEEHKSLYASEESRRVAHILIELNDDVSDADGKADAEAIYARVLAGEDFAELARQSSDDTGSAASGGDLGFNERGIFVDEFEAVVYDLALNEVSEPVLTEFGYHIIKVTGIVEASTPDLDEIRVDIEMAYKDSIAEEDFVTVSARLSELVFESMDLEVPAAELDLNRQVTGNVARTAETGLMANPLIVSAAFSPDVLLDGNNSDVIELDENNHVVLRILEHTPSASRPLADVTEDIRYILMRMSATDLAESRANEIVDAVTSGSLAVYVADQHGLTWERVSAASRTMRGVDPVILSEAFKLPRPALNKETVGYAILPNGDSTVLLVARVNNRQPDELSEIELSSLSRALSVQLGAMDFREFEDSLMESATLVR